jgi:hypothetical protein
VLDDNASDTLFGGTGLDWFLVFASSTNQDTHDQSDWESLTKV